MKFQIRRKMAQDYARETSMIKIADVKDKLDGKVLQQNIDYVLEA